MTIESVELLQGLLKRYSPTGHEADAVSYLVERMRQLGFEAAIDEAGNAIGTMGDGEQTVVLLGHIDTVAGKIETRRDGDVLHGRGAVDAKGPLACFVAAAALAGNVPGRRFVVIGAVGEEGDSRGAQVVRDRYRPRALIIGEPSGWEKLTLGYKGSAWFEFRAVRTLAHTSAQNESACEAAINYWNALSTAVAAQNTGKTKMFDQLLPTLRHMSSGGDGFSEWARLKFGMRLPPGISPDDAVRLAVSVAGQDTVTFLEGVPAYRAEKNTPLVRTLLASIRAAGGAPSFNVKSGTSDMNLVAPVWACPTLAYGPGDSTLDHTPNEHIYISEYLRAIEVLAGALRGASLLE